MLTCPGLELSHTMTSPSVATSGGLSLTSSTCTVTGTWLSRLGLSAGETQRVKGQAADIYREHRPTLHGAKLIGRDGREVSTACFCLLSGTVVKLFSLIFFI